jgi:hypothetical protein
LLQELSDVAQWHTAEKTNDDSPLFTSSNPSPKRIDEAFREESPLEEDSGPCAIKLRLLSNRSSNCGNCNGANLVRRRWSAVQTIQDAPAMRNQKYQVVFANSTDRHHHVLNGSAGRLLHDDVGLGQPWRWCGRNLFTSPPSPSPNGLPAPPRSVPVRLH